MRTAADGAATRYAVEVAGTLWPAPWQVTVDRARGADGAAARELYLFPSARRPRVLVPVDVPAAASMLGRLGSDRSRFAPPARALLVRATRSPSFRRLRWPALRLTPPGRVAGDPADSVEAYLSRELGRDVRAGVVLGVPRPNRKPVLQLFDSGGALAGYAKIGHNTLTAPLVRREAEALAFLDQRRTSAFRSPRLLHSGQWHGLEVLVMSALSGRPGVQAESGLRVAAMREVAALDGIRRTQLADTRFWGRLTAACANLADREVADRLQRSLETIAARRGVAELQLGCWHGDWGDWNMALEDGVAQVWDWERFATEVPVGFDGVHHRAQAVRPENRDLAEREADFLRSVPEVLADFDQDPSQHDLVLVLYLAEISLRYAEALSHAPTPRLRGRAAWSTSLLERLVEDMPGSGGGER